MSRSPDQLVHVRHDDRHDQVDHDQGAEDDQAEQERHGEKDVANWVQEVEGLTLFSKVGGFSGSSTRTELSAAIISIAANGPIHLASDSESFVVICFSFLMSFYSQEKVFPVNTYTK